MRQHEDASGRSPVDASTRTRRRTLSDRVTEDLRGRLRAGEWPAGTRLPGEHALAAHYDVSRATIRTALQSLETHGLTQTRHGAGTYAVGGPEDIHADLRSLDSMTATIQSSGAVADVRYRRREIRPADAEQAERLEIAVGEPVLVTERALTADGRPVAFSYDVIPAALLSEDLDPGTVEGSLYALLDRSGVEVGWAVAAVHAAAGRDIGWGRRPSDALYVLLDQVHRTPTDRPAAWSRSYYLEGRYRFSLVRTR
jgi:GntR family transcriptional regulator